MGIIQSAINQALGTAGMAARLSPGYETRQELYKLGKQEKFLKEQEESTPSVSPEEYEAGKTVAAQEIKRIEGEQTKVAKRQFELKPTKDSMRKYHKLKSISSEAPLATFRNTPEDELMDKMQEVGNKQEKQSKQKRRFKNYLKNLEIAGGGTVGELPSHVQSAIAKQYTKKERTELMDRMDKGGNK